MNEPAIQAPQKCDAENLCRALKERTEIGRGKGLRPLHTINLFEEKPVSRMLGVGYFLDAKDKGLLLNWCPFCGGKPGYFKRASEGGN